MGESPNSLNAELGRRFKQMDVPVLCTGEIPMEYREERVPPVAATVLEVEGNSDYAKRPRH